MAPKRWHNVRTSTDSQGCWRAAAEAAPEWRRWFRDETEEDVESDNLAPFPWVPRIEQTRERPAAETAPVPYLRVAAAAVDRSESTPVVPRRMVAARRRRAAAVFPLEVVSQDSRW